MPRTLTFTKGADTFTQGGSAQNIGITLRMLGGNDRVELTRNDDFGGGTVVDAGAGADVVINLAENGSLIRLGSGNDTYAGGGFGSFATDRSDTVLGGAGNDFIAVTTFASLYKGGTGNDRFLTVGWQNRYEGGAGRDSISYAERDFDNTQGGSGVTVDLAARQAQTGANRFETLIGIEDVIGSGADDALFGTAGTNRLIGGMGLDQLAGRGGADVFVWRSVSEAAMAEDAIDLVQDFSTAQGDRLDLRGMDAVAGRAGNQAFRFIEDDAFSGRAGQLRFADQILSGDVNGDGIADFRIGLLDVSALAASDLLL